MIWNKPWNLAEGFAIGAGVICVGLMLELSVGPMNWDAFAWPTNIISLSVLLGVVTLIHLLRKHVYAFRFLSTYAAAIPTLCYAVALTIIMGLTRQTAEGSWINNMLTFWPFILIYVVITIVLGTTILRRMSHLKGWRDIPFLLNHIGLFIALTTATLGNPDMQKLKMIVGVGETEWRAIDAEGMVKEPPLAIQLNEFIMEVYDDGSPKRFASDVEIYTKSENKYHGIIDVNKPMKVEGWKIYQYGYDTAMGKNSEYSVFELVSDPWLPAAYTGIWMMVAGAVCMLIMGSRASERKKP